MRAVYDWHRIATLLHIVEKLTGHPKLRQMLYSAQKELEELQLGSVEEPSDDPKPDKPSPPLPNQVAEQQLGNQEPAEGEIKRRGLGD